MPQDSSDLCIFKTYCKLFHSSPTVNMKGFQEFLDVISIIEGTITIHCLYPFLQGLF